MKCVFVCVEMCAITDLLDLKILFLFIFSLAILTIYYIDKNQQLSKTVFCVTKIQFNSTGMY